MKLTTTSSHSNEIKNSCFFFGLLLGSVNPEEILFRLFAFIQLQIPAIRQEYFQKYLEGQFFCFYSF